MLALEAATSAEASWIVLSSEPFMLLTFCVHFTKSQKPSVQLYSQYSLMRLYNQGLRKPRGGWWFYLVQIPGVQAVQIPVTALSLGSMYRWQFRDADSWSEWWKGKSEHFRSLKAACAEITLINLCGPYLYRLLSLLYVNEHSRASMWLEMLWIPVFLPCSLLLCDLAVSELFWFRANSIYNCCGPWWTCTRVQCGISCFEGEICVPRASLA